MADPPASSLCCHPLAGNQLGLSGTSLLREAGPLCFSFSFGKCVREALCVPGDGEMLRLLQGNKMAPVAVAPSWGLLEGTGGQDLNHTFQYFITRVAGALTKYHVRGS